MVKTKFGFGLIGLLLAVTVIAIIVMFFLLDISPLTGKPSPSVSAVGYEDLRRSALVETRSTGCTTDAVSCSSRNLNLKVKGEDRLLTVLISMKEDQNSTVTEVKYGHDSLTRLATAGKSGFPKMELWYMLNPAPGRTVEVKFATDTVNNVIATSWQNVNQEKPFGEVATAFPDSNNLELTVSTAGGEQIILDGLAWQRLFLDPNRKDYVLDTKQQKTTFTNAKNSQTTIRPEFWNARAATWMAVPIRIRPLFTFFEKDYSGGEFWLNNSLYSFAGSRFDDGSPLDDAASSMTVKKGS